MSQISLSFSEAVEIVDKSKFFDEKWYRKNFADVALTKMSAAEHYLQIGWRIGRNPSPNFDGSNYSASNDEGSEPAICPLIVFEGSRGGVEYSCDWIGAPPNNKAAPRASDALQTIAQSRLFDEDWYRSQYPEVVASGLDGAEHYLLCGANFQLNPGPNFSTRYYVNKYPDIRSTRINPLFHYEKYGRAEGRVILPAVLDNSATDPSVRASVRPSSFDGWSDEQVAKRFLDRVLNDALSDDPSRFSLSFDHEQAARFVAALEKCASAKEGEELVTVVMPTFNRGSKIGNAIESVLAQSWSNLELIIVDDGSTDDTFDVLSSFDDPRIKLSRLSRSGVSAARNEGLRLATGEVIFYLDSDNTWTRDFVWIMMQSLRQCGASCGYAGTRLETPSGHLLGYRGEPFDWEACLALNYVDMNVFCHRKEVSDRLGVFDTGLKRMVDWDIILRFGRSEKVFYAPVLGCIYLEDSVDLNRITTSQPLVSRKLVHQKNALKTSLQDAAARLSLNIAIKIFAPFADRDAWGDFHYAESLASALEKLGHKVRIDFRGQWYASTTDDVAITLRGLEAYNPRPTEISIFWGISHPDTVSPKELDSYHGIFIASRSHAEMLEILLGRAVNTLWQCTDETRFFPQEGSTALAEVKVPADQGIFIGNSRKEYRPIVRWAIEAGLPLSVIGQDWEEYLPASAIAATNAPNTELAALYGSAAFVLNDHWASMRDFGYVSNRIFDVLAAGGSLISDKVPAASALFGDAVISVSSADELEHSVSHGAMKRDKDEALRLSEAVRLHHSFTSRAQELDRWIKTLIAPGYLDPSCKSEKLPPIAGGNWDNRLPVGVLAQWSKAEALDNTIERIVAPLTSDEAAVKLSLVKLEAPEDLVSCTYDVLIISTADVLWSDRLHSAVKAAMDRGVTVIADCAGPSLPEHFADLEHGFAAVWGSGQADPALRLDPRIWRRYRLPRQLGPEAGKVRLFVVAMAYEADETAKSLEALLAVDFGEMPVSLRAVGFEAESFDAVAWARIEAWPDDCTGYYRRARLLLDHASADFGIIFSESPDCEAQIQRMMAFGMVPVVIGPMPTAIASLDLFEGAFETCGSLAELPELVARIAGDPGSLLERRNEIRHRLWQVHDSKSAPVPQLSAIFDALGTAKVTIPA